MYLLVMVGFLPTPHVPGLVRELERLIKSEYEEELIQLRELQTGLIVHSGNAQLVHTLVLMDYNRIHYKMSHDGFYVQQFENSQQSGIGKILFQSHHLKQLWINRDLCQFIDLNSLTILLLIYYHP